MACLVHCIIIWKQLHVQLLVITFQISCLRLFLFSRMTDSFELQEVYQPNLRNMIEVLFIESPELRNDFHLTGIQNMIRTFCNDRLQKRLH